MQMNRRDFLKSLMASAGIAAAGFPALVAATPVFPVTVSFGDVYVRMSDEWKFVGSARKVSLHRDPLEIEPIKDLEGGPLYRQFVAGPEIRMSVDMIYLPESQPIIDELFDSDDAHEFIFGTVGGQFQHAARVTEFITTVERGNRMAAAEISFLLG